MLEADGPSTFRLIVDVHAVDMLKSDPTARGLPSFSSNPGFSLFGRVDPFLLSLDQVEPGARP